MRSIHRFRLVIPIIILILMAIACNFPQGGTPTPSGPDLLKTYAAQTIQAQLTLVATGLQPTITPGQLVATATPLTEITATSVPELTATPSPTQGICDQAAFEKDINYPDNSVLKPGEEFTKTWRLENTGTCTWNSNYAIVFDRGDAMEGPASAALTSNSIAPGETVDVSVALIAPDTPGTYQGYWMLRNQAGQEFGLGEDGDKNFWVKIKIEPQSGLTYDFNIHAKSATWIGSGGGSAVEVPFDGADDNPDGVAKLKNDFLMENGNRSGWALITGPKKTNDGRITGTFPEYSIADKDHFKAKLGFIENCQDGQVTFQFGFKEGEDIQNLGEWKKSCDGNLIHVDVDLSAYRGKEVQFVLDVLADGSPVNDLVVWGSARIEREQ
jgi:hypothetical protein